MLLMKRGKNLLISHTTGKNIKRKIVDENTTNVSS